VTTDLQITVVHLWASLVPGSQTIVSKVELRSFVVWLEPLRQRSEEVGHIFYAYDYALEIIVCFTFLLNSTTIV